ncbi:hypothetical protein M5K25_004564 [Dendrobium thyrsiflorum]|uniref:Uncharacterized protein n=1 Tax=Dendrobium thyrsiflorum TaxID=117978 RepID=A0ABD0VF71_DENTH
MLSVLSFRLPSTRSVFSSDKRTVPNFTSLDRNPACRCPSALEKEDSQVEIDREKALEALEKLDQQLDSLSQKEVAPKKRPISSYPDRITTTRVVDNFKDSSRKISLKRLSTWHVNLLLFDRASLSPMQIIRLTPPEHAYSIDHTGARKASDPSVLIVGSNDLLSVLDSALGKGLPRFIIRLVNSSTVVTRRHLEVQVLVGNPAELQRQAVVRRRYDVRRWSGRTSCVRWWFGRTSGLEQNVEPQASSGGPVERRTSGGGLAERRASGGGPAERRVSGGGPAERRTLSRTSGLEQNVRPQVVLRKNVGPQVVVQQNVGP